MYSDNATVKQSIFLLTVPPVNKKRVEESQLLVDSRVRRC